MYLPSHRVPELSGPELVCPLTGESYIYVGNEALPPELRAEALERLPNRFFQRPFCVKTADGQLKVIMKELPA
jgi:hypothetical protein